MFSFLCFLSSLSLSLSLLEQELAEEREKLYRAIGYSEKGKVADYPKQVCVCDYELFDNFLPGVCVRHFLLCVFFGVWFFVTVCGLQG